MQVAVDKVVPPLLKSLQPGPPANNWLSNPELAVRVAANPTCRCVAFAAGSCLVVVLQQRQQHSAKVGSTGELSYHRHSVSDTITDIKWLQFRRAAGTAPSSDQSNPCHGPQASTSTGSVASDDAAAAGGDLEAGCWLVATASGCLQIHALNGRMVFRQRLHTSAARAISLRTCRTGINILEVHEELTVTFLDCVVRIAALELRSLLGMVDWANSTGKSGRSPQAAASDVPPMGFQRFELPKGTGPRSAAILLGCVYGQPYDVLQSGAPQAEATTLCLLTAGQTPCLAAFQAEVHPHRGPLALIAGVASGVVGLAKSARSQVTHRISNTQKAMQSGIRTLFTPINSLWGASGRDDAGAGQAVQQAILHDEGEKPPPAEPVHAWVSLRDDARAVVQLEAAPRGGLAAAVDTLNRVVVVDATSMVVIRVLKGFRDAQVAWVEVSAAVLVALQTRGEGVGERLNSTGLDATSATSSTPAACVKSAGLDNGVSGGDVSGPSPQPSPLQHQPDSGYSSSSSSSSKSVLLLAIYSPWRQVIELWRPRSGPRVACVPTGRNCRLIQGHVPFGAADGPLISAGAELVHSMSILVDGDSGIVTPLLEHLLKGAV